MAIRRIRFRRGNQADLPSLATGEPGLALDTSRLYIGGQEGNVEIATKNYVDGEIAGLARVVLAPTTKFGADGDLAGDISYDSLYFYVCVQDYTDGSAQIWERILLDSSW